MNFKNSNFKIRKQQRNYRPLGEVYNNSIVLNNLKIVKLIISVLISVNTGERSRLRSNIFIFCF